MTKEQAKAFTENVKAGIKIYAEPEDLKKQSYSPMVRIVVDMPSRALVKGKKIYHQKKDADLLAKDMIKMHVKIYEARGSLT